jgi:DNA polymerase-3 subunit chi
VNVTEVVFHFNAADKRAHACRLLRKAYLQGARLLVVTEPRELEALDVNLWTLAGRDFIPHARLTDPLEIQDRSPIILVGEWPAQVPRQQDTVLVNLGQEFLTGFDQFARVIEVVSRDLPDRERARERWRSYRAAGIEPARHDFAAR